MWKLKKIPKKLHLYSGGSKLSKLQLWTVISFRRLNPDWKINVYTPIDTGKNEMPSNSFDSTIYEGDDFFFEVEKAIGKENIIKIHIEKDIGLNRNLHNILKSDIFRYYILFKEGGVWSDFDVLWIKAMEYFSNLDFFKKIQLDKVNLGVCNHFGYHSIGILFSSKANPFWGNLIFQAKKANIDNFQSIGSHLLNKLYPNIKTIKEKHLTIHPINIPFKCYYPYRYNQLNFLYEKEALGFLNENTIGVHWYFGDKLSKDFVNDPQSGSRRCSLNKILKIYHNLII